jgi:hypothetical protein
LARSKRRVFHLLINASMATGRINKATLMILVGAAGGLASYHGYLPRAGQDRGANASAEVSPMCRVASQLHTSDDPAERESAQRMRKEHRCP